MPPTGTAISSAPGQVAIHWYRHGLRIHDNPSLHAAIIGSAELYPVFIFDGEVAGTSTAAFNRMRFLLESLHDLDESFKKFGGRLFVFHGKPKAIFTKIFEEWGVTKLTFEQDPEPVWKARDNEIKQLCYEKGVTCIECISHTLWDPKQIIEANGGCPPLTYEIFRQVTSVLGPPPKPLDIPDFSKIKIPVQHNHAELYGIPSLQDLGINPDCQEQLQRVHEWVGGETKGQELLGVRINVERKAFEEGIALPNQVHPDLLGTPRTLSPHLRFGCISVRKFYWCLFSQYSEVYPGETPPHSIYGQLLWRDYFYTMSVDNGKYDRMEGNPICLNIPWSVNPEYLDQWTKGETGYPWIDAIMKQLLVEGWVHHVCRHAVSCFLTRGDLWISWEEGLKVFYKYLLDADWSVCAGNWMWVSSSAFEEVLQCPRCYCPVMYGRKMDPKGEYIRRYLPVLKDMPLRYLFEPWKAPREVQEKANCIIGKDYPEPMVEHKKASAYCKKMMEEVKNNLRRLNPEISPHCAPSNPDEVSLYTWIPNYHNGKEKACAMEADHDCN
ncbi:hypothetical protein CHS0354_011477 [Potamilus streckersoni]|uniref:Cryptochrome-1 n=1 Tax=Potamilus streckersoni TaxID=2493646 RepID=A0AAE0SKS8_9BIVA|nr:hypothetical protein CHS0354_011477 [Potamilus streckersoni]